MSFVREKLESGWRSAKRTWKLPVGPIAVLFRFSRNHSPLNGPKRYPTNNWDRIPLSLEQKADTQCLKEQEHFGEKPKGTALVVGVGSGLGASLARIFSANGMQVALASRRVKPLQSLVDQLNETGPIARAYACDATAESSVARLLDNVAEDFDVPDVVVFSLQSFTPGKSLDIDIPAFEESWRHNCLAGFIVARHAAQRMLIRKRGTIVLVGSTSSLMGRANHLNLAVGKFGLRAIAQTMAQELWSEGIHVVHVVIDAHITSPEEEVQHGPNRARPEDISEWIYAIHKQPQSAWTSELDIRPFSGAFWQHC